MGIDEKFLLNISEASEYFNIGKNKLYELTKDPMNDFVIFIGNKRLIKRKQFEKFLERKCEI